VNHHDEKTVHTIFSKVQKHLAYEDQALRHFIALCDGHPRILSYMLDTTFALASRPPGKQRIEKRDIEPILTTVLERIDNSLWLLRLRLSQEELAVVWLISQTIPSLIDRLEYSLHGLVDLADQYLISSTADRNDSASVQRVDATFEESASEKHLIQEPLSIFQSIPPERLYDLIEEGTANLEAREWIEWQNWNERLFCFRLGIFPLWVRRRHIILGKVRH
jgi:hypothetical protein